MQLAVAELDPELDPFTVVGSFLLRNLGERVRRQAEPERLYYEGQKLKLRAGRLFEAVERATGARPGPKLQVDFLGSAGIEEAIRRAGRRLALAVVAAAGLAATGITAASEEPAGWVPGTLAAVAAASAAWLGVDLFRRR